VGTDEFSAGHDLNAGDDDQYADDAGDHAGGAREHTDVAGELTDGADGADDHAGDLDPDKFIHVPGKPQLDAAADDVDAERDADIPERDLGADDADSGRDVDEPDAGPDPAPGGRTDKPGGVRRSSQSARCFGQRWSPRSSPAPTLGSRRVKAPCQTGLKSGN